MKNTLALRTLLCALGAWLGFALMLSTAAAQDPVTDIVNECPEPGGQGTPCAVSNDCAQNTYATICIEHVRGDPSTRTCEIPCETAADADAQPEPGLCSTGETCIEGKASPGRPAYFCQPSRFRMDLNLLDACVQYWIEGTQPNSLGSDNVCSLEANLNRLLDQDGNNTFDIFDLDMCVLAFLEQPVCDPTEESCEAPDLVFCDEDDDCGQGLYCDLDRNACTRDCGFIASREEEGNLLDRRCTGALKTCDYSRGRCEPVELADLTCNIDRDCPPGGYCLLGQCAPKCSRSIDCPDGRWYCTENNACRALPSAEANDGFVFNPERYSIQFARNTMSLDAVENETASAIAIIDLNSRRQVRDNPAVSFGYRLEVTYNRKQDTACLKPFVDCADESQRDESENEEQCFARQSDCLIDDTEEWIQLVSPFGVVTAAGQPALEVALNPVAADRLSPGYYTANLRAIYDNGTSDTIVVSYNKSTLSGEYSGDLSVYLGHPRNGLNSQRPIPTEFRISISDEIVRWNEVQEAFNLEGEQDIVDITQGYLVTAQLHGNSSYAFTKGGESDYDKNEIPFVGLYSPQLRRMRLLGIIDVEKNFCISFNGNCSDEDNELQARNLFGRAIRRQIEFIGPFDEATRIFNGAYREKISGIAAHDITLDGSFTLRQTIPDASPLVVEGDALLSAGQSAVGFPDLAAINTALNSAINTACSDHNTERGYFASQSSFAQYIAGAERTADDADDAIFPDLVGFSGAIENALTGLGLDSTGDVPYQPPANNSGSARSQMADRITLTLHDYLAGRILPCDANNPSPPPGCVTESEARCGLLLYQKAIVNGWAFDTSQAADQVASGLSTRGELPIFCSDTLRPSGCLDNGQGRLTQFSLQEHNYFWYNLSQILKFDGDHAQSDAFVTLYRNAVNPFQIGTAVDYKRDKLLYALKRYNQNLELILSPQSTSVLYSWPMNAYLQRGNNWIGTMQTLFSDRISTIGEFADLERRVFSTADNQSFLVAQHLMQHEYLQQVMLIDLQREWQGSNFAYEGAANTIFEQGQTLLSQYNPARNPLGVAGGQVFFENGDPDVSNWKNYRNILMGEDGLMENAEAEIDAAVENLQNSLTDLDAYEAEIFHRFNDNDYAVAELCGDPEIAKNKCLTAKKNYSDEGNAWQNTYNCLFDEDYYATKTTFEVVPGSFIPRTQTELINPELNGKCSEAEKNASFRCKDVEVESSKGLSAIAFIFSGFQGSYRVDDVDNCQEVTKTVQADFNGFSIDCPYDADNLHYITLRGQKRACSGGAAGEILTERAALVSEREEILGSITTMLRNMQYALDAHEKKTLIDDALFRYERTKQVIKAVYDVIVQVTALSTKIAKEQSEAIKCLLVAGFSVGTDCPQGAAKAAVRSGVTVLETLKIIAGVIKDNLEDLESIFVDRLETDQDVIDFWTEMAQAEREIDDYTEQFRNTSRGIYALDLQLDEIQFFATKIFEGYDGDVQFYTDRLIGRETGSTLFGRQLVLNSSKTFREVHQYSFRMLQAFIHQYNLPQADAETLTNRLLAAITLDDIQAIVDELDQREREYCGQEGIDCDAFNNVEVLRVSLRDTLFPNLRDIVDPISGDIVTAGEQFHNIITSPPFTRRRIFGPLRVDQVELPFSLPLTIQQNTPLGPAWMINPLSCSQYLTTRTDNETHPGNVAVNFVGSNLGDGSQQLRYELVRGETDYVRSCNLESVIVEEGQLPELQYPIRSYTIGYAPQSPQGRRDTPPTFVTRSGPLSGCINQPENAGDLDDNPECWRYFARGRTLSSQQWKIQVPLSIDDAATENTWVLGDGLPDETRPLIEDIVLYFRYSSRPIGE